MWGNLLSEIIVQGVKGGGQSLGSSLGQAGGNAIGQALAQGFGGGIGGSGAIGNQDVGQMSGDKYYVRNADGSMEQVDSRPDWADGGGSPTEVANIDVVSPRANVPALAASAPLSFQSYGDVAPAALPQLLNMATPQYAPEVAGLDIVAPGASSITQPDSVLSRMAPLTGLASQSAGMPTSEDVYGGEKPGGGIDEKGLLAMLGLGGGAAGLLKGGLSLLPAGLMAAQLLSGQKDGNKAGQQNQQQQQDTLGNIGQLAGQNSGLSKFLSDKAMANLGGNIGGPAMSAIQRAVRASQARIRSRYHQMGMSGSTAEGQDLQAAELQGVETQFKVAQDMATQGLASVAQLTGQSMNAYTQILNAQMMQGTALGNAAASFAASSTGALGEIGKMMDKYL